VASRSLRRHLSTTDDTATTSTVYFPTPQPSFSLMPTITPTPAPSISSAPSPMPSVSFAPTPVSLSPTPLPSMIVIVRDPVVETSKIIPIIIGAILVLLVGCVLFNRKKLSQEQLHEVSAAVRAQRVAEEQKEKEMVSKALKKVRGKSSTRKAKPTPKKALSTSKSVDGSETDPASMDDSSSGSEAERASIVDDEETQNGWSPTRSVNNSSKRQSPKMQHRTASPASVKDKKNISATNKFKNSRTSRALPQEDDGNEKIPGAINGQKAPLSVVSHRSRRGLKDLDAFLENWKLMSLSRSLTDLGYTSPAELVRDWNSPGPRAVLTVSLQEFPPINQANHASSSKVLERLNAGMEDMQRSNSSNLGARVSSIASTVNPGSVVEASSMTADVRELVLAAQDAVRRGDFSGLKNLLQKAQKVAEEQRQMDYKERKQAWDATTSQKLPLLPLQIPQGFGHVLGLTDNDTVSSPRFNEDEQWNGRASRNSAAKSGDYARGTSNLREPSNPLEPSSPRQPSSPRGRTPLRAALGQGDNDGSIHGKGRSSISVRGASFVRSSGPSMPRPPDSASKFGMGALGFEASAAAPPPASADRNRQPKDAAGGAFGPVIGTFF